MSSGNDSMAAQAELLKPGFANAVFESQTAFRAILNAMSYAGRIQDIGIGLDGPAPLDIATTAAVLTLFDFDTSVWLDSRVAQSAVPEFVKFHCGSPITAAALDAQFAIISDPATMPSLDSFGIGEDRYPDRSATIIIQVPTLTEGPVTHWTGPGIEKVTDVRIGGLPESFWAQWALNHELYPLGLDIIFASGSAVIGLPRGVKVEG
ncbi:MAG TPA: phosphonate C-P lyase system protein PhnH [Devosiaceae bacterium]|jgi:alpha-D-ribose 1-methylphosphonate 5-triphosphate synthase subunit PhnH